MRRPGGPRPSRLVRLALPAMFAVTSTVFVPDAGSAATRAASSPAGDGASISELASSSTTPPSDASVVIRRGMVPYRTPGSTRRSTASIRNTATLAQLSYYGGPVVSAAEVRPVLLGSGTYVPELTAPGSPNMTSFLDTFLKSAAYTWLNEYDTNIRSAGVNPVQGTNQHIVAGTVQPTVPIARPAGNDFTDVDVESMLDDAITAGTVPAPTVDAGGHANTVYPIFVPAGIRICIPSQGTEPPSCSLQSGGFCAYHGAFDHGGVPVLYTVQPHLANVAGGGCGPGTNFQVTTAVMSHELVEAVTDPLVTYATGAAPPLAWYDADTSGLGEITDICQDTVGTITGGTPAQQYVVQGQWSNATAACIVDKVQPPLTQPSTAPLGAALDTSKPVERLLDTRNTAAVGPQGVVTIHTTVPGAAAVVLNVTATGATSSTFVSVYPCDQGRPTVSSLNVIAGDTVANLVTVQLAANGDVCAFNNAGRIHLVVDQMSSYREVDNPVAGGRFVPVTPARALDTRLTNSPFGAGEERTLDLKGVGVPDNALAAVVTVTAPEAIGPGYWAVWPSGVWPGTSSLNLSSRNQTRANQSVVPLDGGTIKLRSQIGGHLVVDLAGWFTGAGGAVSRTGLFHPVTPERVIDTRPGGRPVTSLYLDFRRAFAGGASAIAVNATATEPVGAGFLTAYPEGASRPTASNLNFTTGGTVPCHVVVGMGDRQLDVYSSVSTHLLIDVFGWYS